MNGDYNSIHPQVKMESEQLSVGVYYNSMERVSVYVGYTLDLEVFDVELGVATGYNDYLQSVMPYVRVKKDIKNGTVFIAPVGEVINDNYRQGAVVGFEIFLDK